MNRLNRIAYSHVFSAREGVLYHGTKWVHLADIFKSNCLFASDHSLNGTSQTVSLTRSYEFAESWQRLSVILAFDQRKLIQHHKISPYNFNQINYSYSFSDFREAPTRQPGESYTEERVNGNLDNLLNCLIGVYIPEKLLTRLINEYAYIANHAEQILNFCDSAISMHVLGGNEKEVLELRRKALDRIEDSNEQT